MPKYRDFVRKMFEEHEKEFAAFAEVHVKYQSNQAEWQEEYNRIGAPIADIIREYERKLCGYSEKGQYAKYSATLAEKFKDEIKAFFPLVDFIGAKTSKPVQFSEKKQNPTPSPEPKDKDLEYIDKLDEDFDIKKLF